ncbi:YceI family protein [Amycolatopsis sp. lyj-346]|uniref:YceI family protein n=1 Tax=Amycolatopsis sp. lyj-346 TaxID=2789289 RepID=UPI00397975C7
MNAPAPGRYGIDVANSVVKFETRHFFGLAGVTGTFAIAGGEVVVDPVTEKSTARVTVDAASFRTNTPARDKAIRSRSYLHTDSHPTIGFVSSGLREANGSWVLSGDLTVREVTRPVEFTVERAEPTASGFQAHATTRIDRHDFGVSAARGMVARILTMSVDVTANRVAAPEER